MPPPVTDDPRPAADPLEELRERIRTTADAAERLAAEAGAAGPPGSEAPPRGDEAAHEARALLALVQMLGDLLPPELLRQVTDLVRQVLLLVRAIIDWWVARLEPDDADGRAVGEPVVEDIPLD